MQKINIFFSFNITSTLSSMLTVNKYFIDDINILCIEKQSDRDESLYAITDILLENDSTFDNIIYIDAQQYIFGKRKLIKSLEYIEYYKKAYNGLKSRLEKVNINNIDRVFTSQVGRLWPFFIEKNCSLYLIEHSFGDYIFYDRYNSEVSGVFEYLNIILNKIWNRIYRYKFINKSTKINGAFFNLDILRQDDSNVKYVYNDELITNIIHNFWKNFSEKYSNEYYGLKELVLAYDRNIYFYLPSNEVKNDKYFDFLQKQIEKLGLKRNSLVILKEHPASRSKAHKDALDKSFDHVVEINDPIVLNIPMEFYSILFKKAYFVGTISSTFIYLKHLYKNTNYKAYTDIFTKYRYFLDTEDLLERGNNDKFFTDWYIEALK